MLCYSIGQMTSSVGSSTGTLRAARAQDTRERIVEAARGLFLDNGYHATTLPQIAARAGVAIQTVYAVYGSKAGILAVLADSATHQPDALAAYERAIKEESPTVRLDLFAAAIRERWERSYDCALILKEAERTEKRAHDEVEPEEPTAVPGLPRARRLGEKMRAGHQSQSHQIAHSLRDALAPGLSVERAAALIDALTLPELYGVLVGRPGELLDTGVRSPTEYQSWLARTLRQQLLA